MDNQGDQPPPAAAAAPAEADEEQPAPVVVATWPNVYPGKELTLFQRQQVIQEHMAMAQIFNVRDIRGVAHSFIPPIPPPLVTVTGTVFASFDFEFPSFLRGDDLPSEGTTRDNFFISNPFFAGTKDGSFWALMEYTVIDEDGRYGESKDLLIKLKLLSQDVPAVPMDPASEERGDPFVGAVEVVQSIKAPSDFENYFEIVPNWRVWIPQERLHAEYEDWNFTSDSDFAPSHEVCVRVLGDMESRDMHEFRFEKRTIAGNTDWYCYAVTHWNLMQVKAGLALVPPADVTALDLDNDDWDDHHIWTIRP